MPEATTIIIIVYIAFSLLVGLCGSQRRMGFLGTFILSLVLTPLIVLLVLILTAASRRVEQQRTTQRN